MACSPQAFSQATLAGLPIHSDERKENVTTNLACFSPITSDEASWLTVNYAYDLVSERMMPASGAEAGECNREYDKEMFALARNLFTDSFH